MNPHLQTPVRHSGAPLATASHAVIAVHGRNGSPESLEATVARLNWPSVACIAPAAHNKAWYPERFMVPTERNQPWLDHALEAYDSWVQHAISHGIPRERIILLGFSQGACLTAEYAVRNATRYAGVVLFTGGVIGPEGTTWNNSGSFDGTPVYSGTGDTDEWIPLSRARETADVMRRMGAMVHERVLPSRPHTVSDTEIRDVQDIFRTIIAP